MRVNWKAVWLTVWFGFLIADQFLNLRAGLVDWATRAENAMPDLFYRRLETGLLVIFVLIAIAPISWMLVRRWFFQPAPAALEKSSKPDESDIQIVRDPRDVSAAEAIRYIAGETAWARTYEGAEGDRLSAAARLLEEAARKGRLTLRGRRVGGQRYLEPIDRAYWSAATLDLEATFDEAGSGGTTRATDGAVGPKPPVYDHLVVDRESVERLWPRDNLWRKSGRATVRGMAWSVGLRRRKTDEEESES